MSDNGGDPKKDKKKRMVHWNRDLVIKKLLHRHVERKPSPLVTLKEIFEESPDKDRFVGDTMFWKYFEDIDINRIYHTNSVEFRNLKLMFWEVVFFLILLLMFTIYAYALQSRDVFDARQEQVRYWSGCEGVDDCKIDEVNSVQGFWGWMSRELVPRAFTTYASMPHIASIPTVFANSKFPLTWTPRFVGPQMSNVLLGTIRVRQLRVTKDLGCTVSKLLSHVFPHCYGHYQTSYASKADYAPRYAPTYLSSAFQWQGQEATRQISTLGSMNTYGGDGYMVDLPNNEADALTMVSDLWHWHWVDPSTRAILVELSTLNTNVNTITNTRILFEFGPTGSVVSEVKTSAIRVFFFTPSTKAGADAAVFILQIVLFLLMLVFNGWVFFMMYKTCHNYVGEHPLAFLRKSRPFGIVSFFVHTIGHYFTYGWNLVDVVILVLFYAHMGLRFSAYSHVSGETALAPDVIGHPEVFMPFSKVMQPLINGNNVLSFLAICFWMRLFKYLCMSKYFRLLVRIIERCAARLALFSAILLVVFFGFAIAFYVGFGATYDNFSTISGSFLVLFFLMLDGYKLEAEWFEPGTDQMIPFIFFCYIAIIYFILLNVFIAIVLDVYATSEHNAHDGPEKKNPMVAFVWTYYNWMKGIALAINDSEESMRSEDLSIRLELLPGIVRRKWIEKKRNMQRVANESFAGLELFPGDIGIQGSHVALTDWTLPSTRTDVVDRMHDRGSQGKALAVYDIPDSMLQSEVSRSQLQRLMDEDETLPVLLNSKKAVDVIRRFKHGGDPQGMLTAEEEVTPVKSLQGAVFGKIDQLEKVKLDGDVPKVPVIDELTEAMSTSLTEVRNQFRMELTTIIEATAVLFEHLVELTQGIDAVRSNHEAVLDMVRQDTGRALLRG